MGKRMQLANKTAVVTGAASGIGRALAVSLARRGCHLALADINEEGLAETAVRISAPHLRISTHRLDVAAAAAVAAFPDVVRTEHPGVDLLFNNAGVALGGAFEQISAADFEWLFAINFWGVVRMTRAFLPLLRASEEARLVNLSSLFGLIGPSGQTAYAASKFAVRGFSESLRHELADTNVGVTVVHPGGVATEIANTARLPAAISAEEAARGRQQSNQLLKMPPAEAGEIIVRGVERRQSRILVGSDAKLLALLARLAPVSYWRLLQGLLR